MLGWRRHLHPGLGVVLFAVIGCGGSEADGPVDPEVADAWRIEQERLVAERRAEQEASATRESELEGAALAIESESGDPPRLLAEQEVSQLLVYYCAECHGRAPGPSSAIDGLWDIDDVGEMVRLGKVLPGDGEGSQLIQRVRRGEMPPSSAEGPRMPAATVDRLVDYIDSLPADSFE